MFRCFKCCIGAIFIAVFVMISFEFKLSEAEKPEFWIFFITSYYPWSLVAVTLPFVIESSEKS